MNSAELEGETRPTISIVFPYYDNPQMLTFQLGIFKSYSPEVLNRCEIILVDDCSPTYPAREVVSETGFADFRLFRLALDKPWNQDAARNIGAFEARGEYLLLTDIDHVIPEETLKGLMALNNQRTVYTLARKAHFSETVIASHVNSYFMAKTLYWSIGGYDEEFWGTYGSDRLFRNRVRRLAPIVELTGVRLELVTQGSIADAKNVSFSRQPPLRRRVRSLVLRALKGLGLRRSPVVLVNAYSAES